MSTVRRRREAGCKRVGGEPWSTSPWLDRLACWWLRRHKISLIVNLKTDEALGLTLAPVFLGRADEVIR
jgi:hypothetical protein